MAEMKRYTPEEAVAALARMKIRPLKPWPGAVPLWPVQCLVCGHKFSGRWNRMKHGDACPECRRQRHENTEGKARARQAERDLRAAGMKPLEPYKNSHTPWRSQCLKCGAIRSPRLAGVRNGQGACLTCSREASAARRRMPKAEVLQIMKAAGLVPDRGFQYKSVMDPIPATCMTCGRRVNTRINALQKSKRGCKRCSMVEGGIGFDVWSPGVIYLIAHKKYKALKIGITSTNTTHERLAAHRHHGWTVVREWVTETGQQAVFVEGEVLKWLRDDLGTKPCVLPEHMPQGGWTETVLVRQASAQAIARRVTAALKRAVDLPPLPDRHESKIGRRAFCPVVKANGNRCRRRAAIGAYCVNHATRIEKYGDPLKGPRTLGEKCLVVVDGVECGKKVRSRDMCSVHYERWYTHGDPHFMLRPTPGTRSPTCIVEVDGQVCGVKVIAQELCAKHYGHWSRHGDPLAGRFENPGAPCSVVEDGEPCPRLSYCRGMCSRHYHRFMQYGDPLVTTRLPYEKRPRACIVVDEDGPCNGKVISYGRCNKHRKRDIKKAMRSRQGASRAK